MLKFKDLITGPSLFGFVSGLTFLFGYMRRGRREKRAITTHRKLCSISAPGKALIAGGYLVLESPNVGITVAATSRFFATVDMLTYNYIPRSDKLNIIVESPQFGVQFSYIYSSETNVLEVSSDKGNEFVEKCLLMVMSFLQEYFGKIPFQELLTGISKTGIIGIKLRADNDFYSQIVELEKRGKPLSSSSLRELPRFLVCPKDSNGSVRVSKTGMGSSAALTTALVGALLQWFGVVCMGTRVRDEDRRLIHNLAQLAHAVAQGKIGSGFDVAAAVYGTQTYRRFSAAALADCMEATVRPAAIFAAVTDARRWSHEVSAFALPPQLDIVMGDVCGGSSSASMAREVLRWRKDGGAAAEQLWADLAATNSTIAEALAALTALAKSEPLLYQESLSWAAVHTADSWLTFPGTATGDTGAAVVEQLLELRRLFLQARTFLRTMGEHAGVGIEPPQQTALADATSALPGVLCAGVPGAGGVDAIFAITLSAAAREAVELMWSRWGKGAPGETAVCALMLKAEGGATAGVRLEPELAWD